jgi:hypothetical protein
MALTNNDLSKIQNIVKTELKDFIKKGDLKPIKRDINQIKKDLNQVVGTYDARLVRLEKQHDFSPFVD